jgi:hypothetical protein
LRGPAGQIYLQHIRAEPAAHRFIDDVLGREALDLGQTRHTFVGLDLGDAVLGLLVPGLPVLVVRPPMEGFRNVDNVECDAGDFHIVLL